MRVAFHFETSRGPETIRALAALLEALTLIDEDQIAAGGVPDLYGSGARYRSEVRRTGRRLSWSEDWRDARTVARERHGDCEDLASYRAAWLRAHGIAARALPVYMRPGLVHCVVLLPDGTIEDPSALLGMRSLGSDYAAPVAATLHALGEV